MADPNCSNGDDDTDDTYRVVTFHPHKGAPPTMAMTELHVVSHYQVAMRALPDLPDDPGALPIALDTDELVEALGSICAHLDEDKPTQGSTGLHDDQIVIHWYLRDHPTTDDDDWLPHDVSPDHVVVWWATASVDPDRYAGRVAADRLCRRLNLPNLTGASRTEAEDRLAGAMEALLDLVGDSHGIAELTALTHEGATIGLGPSRHLRVAQAVASATNQQDVWASAAFTALTRADALAAQVFPVLSGLEDHDPRRSALTDAIVGWAAGMALSADLRHEDLAQLVAPVTLVVRPGKLAPVDLDGPFAGMIDELLGEDRRLLASLRPSQEAADRASVARARRRLRMALAGEWFRGLTLSVRRRQQLEDLTSDRSSRTRLELAVLDLCAAPFCGERDPSLETLRPLGLPDDLWERWTSWDGDGAGRTTGE